jgi:hypothetical protein
MSLRKQSQLSGSCRPGPAGPIVRNEPNFGGPPNGDVVTPDFDPRRGRVVRNEANSRLVRTYAGAGDIRPARPRQTKPIRTGPKDGSVAPGT